MTIHRHSKAARRFLIAGAAGLLFAAPVDMQFGGVKAGEPRSGRGLATLEQILNRETAQIAAEPAAPMPHQVNTAMPIIKVAHPTVQSTQSSAQPAAQQPVPRRENGTHRVRRFQSVVEQELERLRQSDNNSDAPRFYVPEELREASRRATEQQGGYASPKKRTFTDWLKPRTWRQRMTRRQNPGPVYQPPVESFETGAPAPLPSAVPPAVTQSAPAPAPSAAPVEELNLPQVSPEIFTLESDAVSAADAAPSAEPTSRPSPFPGLGESDEQAAGTDAEPKIEFFFAQPEEDARPFVEPQTAPPADPLPVAEQPAALTEARPRLELPANDAASTPELTVESSPNEAAEAPSESGSPFSGLELETSPYADPQPAGRSDRRSVTSDKPAAPLSGPSLSGPSLKGAPGELPQVSRQRPLAGTGISVASSAREKMELIAARKGLKGFKGFCPVMLRDTRELVDASLEHSAIYRGKQYWFSSEATKNAFLANPDYYAPASGGIDLVHFSQTGEKTDGSLDHAVWFRGQLYLFSSAENKAEFVAAPRNHLPAN